MAQVPWSDEQALLCMRPRIKLVLVITHIRRGQIHTPGDPAHISTTHAGYTPSSHKTLFRVGIHRDPPDNIPPIPPGTLSAIKGEGCASLRCRADPLRTNPSAGRGGLALASRRKESSPSLAARDISLQPTVRCPKSERDHSKMRNILLPGRKILTGGKHRNS